MTSCYTYNSRFRKKEQWWRDIKLKDYFPCFIKDDELILTGRVALTKLFS